MGLQRAGSCGGVQGQDRPGGPPSKFLPWSGPLLRFFNHAAGSSVARLPNPGGDLRDAGASASPAIAESERWIILRRAAAAPIPIG